MIDSPKTPNPKKDRQSDSAVAHKAKKNGGAAKRNRAGQYYYEITKRFLCRIWNGLKSRSAEQWIAIGTWVLACVTIGLLVEARNASEHRLRAYMGIGEVFIERFGTKDPDIRMTMHNFGLTPADNVIAFTHHYFMKDSASAVPEKARETTREHVFGLFDPGKQNPMEILPKKDIFSPQEQSLKEHTTTFFVDTIITYKDAFERCYKRFVSHHLNWDLVTNRDKMVMYITPGRSIESQITCK